MTPGRVLLVGAGPGDPELLTLKAVRALARADVILVDELVNPAVLAHSRPQARVLNVGKRGGCRSTPQAFIERLLVRYARQGRTVVRLKGGDPFIFGRGGEEWASLVRAGVDVEVVSGVTAGVAAPASLGIPLTHRDCGPGVAFMTGHTQHGRLPDFAAVVKAGLTLVIYMGMANLAAIVAQLRGAGVTAELPVAVIERGTLAGARSVITTLERLDTAVAASRLQSPAVIVLGKVVAVNAALGSGAVWTDVVQKQKEG